MTSGIVDVDTVLTQAPLDNTTGVNVATINGSAPSTTGDTADAVWDEAASGHDSGDKAGTHVFTALPTVAPGAANGLFIAGTNAQTTVTSGFGTDSITATSIAADAITNLELATSAAGEVADNVWDETATSHTDAGKAGAQLWTDVDAILDDTDDIGVAGAGLTEIAGAIWNALTASYTVSGSFGEALGAPAPPDDLYTYAPVTEDGTRLSTYDTLYYPMADQDNIFVHAGAILAVKNSAGFYEKAVVNTVNTTTNTITFKYAMIAPPADGEAVYLYETYRYADWIKSLIRAVLTSNSTP
jgi:hypothetical protein